VCRRFNSAPRHHLKTRVRQAFPSILAHLEPPLKTLKIPQVCPKLCPRESKRNQLQPTPAKIERIWGGAQAKDCDMVNPVIF